ncbi:MAG: hypothetical protein JJV96_01855 [Alphaproteobacteria bacterium]|nr:hypothetical protein [Alphaproteobacteria bacterium]
MNLISTEKFENSWTTRTFKYENIEITGYFDEEKLLSFVIDNSYEDILPIINLFIDPLKGETNTVSPETKWDTIIIEKYKLNLENIRPKNKNLYKKLDIFYEGLDFYQKLFTTAEKDNDIDNLQPILGKIKKLRIFYAYDQFKVRLLDGLEHKEKANSTLENIRSSIKTLTEKLEELEGRKKKLTEKFEKSPNKKTRLSIESVSRRLKKYGDQQSKLVKREQRAERNILHHQNNIDDFKTAIIELERLLEGDIKKPTIEDPTIKSEIDPTVESPRHIENIKSSNIKGDIQQIVKDLNTNTKSAEVPVYIEEAVSSKKEMPTKSDDNIVVEEIEPLELHSLIYKSPPETENGTVLTNDEAVDKSTEDDSEKGSISRKIVEQKPMDLVWTPPKNIDVDDEIDSKIDIVKDEVVDNSPRHNPEDIDNSFLKSMLTGPTQIKLKSESTTDVNHTRSIPTDVEHISHINQILSFYYILMLTLMISLGIYIYIILLL